jgi:ABC-type nickel/cobalt efflux system permease component RcnA
MRYNTISGRSPIGEAVWIVAGIIIMFAFGDAFVLSALAFGIVIMTGAWLTYRRAERRAEKNDAEMVPVIQLRPALTAQRHSQKAAAHETWRGPSAAA